jgi:quercetin dioxygenase-like cupin family protein
MMENEFPKATVFRMNEEIQYSTKSIVSRTVIKRATGNISVFAFDAGEGLSEHAAPFDAIVQIIDGKGEIIIDGRKNILNSGDSIIMPANITHAVKAIEKFKMILTMIKE